MAIPLNRRSDPTRVRISSRTRRVTAAISSGRLGIIHAEDDAGRVVEGLLVPVEDGLFTDVEGTFADTYLDQPYRRPSRCTEHGLCLFVKVRAEVDIRFSSGQFHGKREAGGIAALLAVLLGQKFVDIQGLECHHCTPAGLVRFFMLANASRRSGMVFG